MAYNAGSELVSCRPFYAGDLGVALVAELRGMEPLLYGHVISLQSNYLHHSQGHHDALESNTSIRHIGLERQKCQHHTS
jgi:hypothetical protein